MDRCRVNASISSLAFTNLCIGISPFSPIGDWFDRLTNSPDTLAPFGAKTRTVSSRKFTLQGFLPTRPGTALPRFVWSAYSDAYPLML